eukprot:2730398-Alexandrium_andersonii.AAC.1
MVVATASPKKARNRSSELSRVPFLHRCFALSTNMARRTSPELVWDSFCAPFRAERGGGDCRMAAC